MNHLSDVEIGSDTITAGLETELLSRIIALARREARRHLDDDQADDLAQVIAIECLNKLQAGNWTVCLEKLGGLIHEAVKWRAADMRRRNKARRRREEAFARFRADESHLWMMPDASIDETELLVLRDRALAQVPARCREIYLLVRDDTVTNAAVAERFGISRSRVCGYVAEAQRAVRETLAREGVLEMKPRSGAEWAPPQGAA